MRLRRYGIVEDSGGAGRYRGGCGIVREYEILAEEAVLAVRIDSVKNPPWGIAGGMSGGAGRAVVNPGTPQERVLAPLSDGNMLKRGDILRIETGGGGGYGHPHDRPAEDGAGGRARRLREPRKRPRAHYGVVDPRLRIDQDATAALSRQPHAGPGIPPQRVCRCPQLSPPRSSSPSISAAPSPTSRCYDPRAGSVWRAKTPSVPSDPSRGVPRRRDAGAGRRPGASAAAVGRVLHGTTVATNMILEGKGARTALVTTAGFRHVLDDRPAGHSAPAPISMPG